MNAQVYTFDTSFDDPEAVLREDRERERLVKRYTEVDLTAARQAAFAEGRETGRAEAMAEIEARAAAALEQAARQLEALGAAQEAAARRMTEQGIAIAAAIAGKAAPDLARRNALGEIEHVVADCLKRLAEEPRVVVRVHDSLLDPLRGRVDRLAEASGFAGTIVLLADANLAEGDCRVEWADGGAERDTARLWQEIETVVRRTIGNAAVPGPTAGPPPPDGEPQPAAPEPPPAPHPEPTEAPADVPPEAPAAHTEMREE